MILVGFAIGKISHCFTVLEHHIPVADVGTSSPYPAREAPITNGRRMTFSYRHFRNHCEDQSK